MLISIDSKLMSCNEPYDVTFNEVSECPHCRKVIKPTLINSILVNKRECNEESECFNFTFSTFNFCNSCYHTFLAEYTVTDDHDDGDTELLETSRDYVGPSVFAAKTFDPCIEKISPNFVDIYNQALQAETLNLPLICGMAYRKSLEFLIKDYAISENPNDVKKIEAMALATCITTYISDPAIQSLAKSATWLGNDETHYIKKHLDKNISHLKKFIDATQYFICMKAIAAEAAQFVTP